MSHPSTLQERQSVKRQGRGLKVGGGRHDQAVRVAGRPSAGRGSPDDSASRLSFRWRAGRGGRSCVWRRLGASRASTRAGHRGPTSTTTTSARSGLPCPSPPPSSPGTTPSDDLAWPVVPAGPPSLLGVRRDPPPCPRHIDPRDPSVPAPGTSPAPAAPATHATFGLEWRGMRRCCRALR
jgi:hypothetical protein